METTKQYIYDEQGNLLEVKELQHNRPTQAELIAKKEAELIAMYNELKALKGEA